MRLLFEVVLPILLPALIYLGYLRVERRRAEARGDPATLPWWATTPWVALAAAGVLLAAVLLSVVVLRSGSPVGGVYVPAHMENGGLVPGHVESPRTGGAP